MIRFISVLLFALTLGTAQAQTTVGWLTNATGLASLPPTSSRQAVSVGNESSGWSQWNWNAASTASTNSTVVAYTGLATGRWIQSPITGVAVGLTTATVPTTGNAVVNLTSLNAAVVAAANFPLSVAGLTLTIGAGTLTDGNGAPVAVPATTVQLQPSRTNHVVISLRDLSAHAYTRGWDDGSVVVGLAVTGTNSVTSLTSPRDYRIRPGRSATYLSRANAARPVRVFLVGDSISGYAGTAPYWWQRSFDTNYSSYSQLVPGTTNVGYVFVRVSEPGVGVSAGLPFLSTLGTTPSAGATWTYDKMDQAFFRFPSINSRLTAPDSYVGLNQVAGANPDLVVMELGGNAEPDPTITADLQQIEMQLAYWRSRGVAVVMIPGFRIGDATVASKESALWRTMADAYGATLADGPEAIRELYSLYQQGLGPNPTSDGTHLSVTGAAAVSAILLGALHGYATQAEQPGSAVRQASLSTANFARPAPAIYSQFSQNITSSTGYTNGFPDNIRTLLINSPTNQGAIAIPAGGYVTASFPFVSGKIWAIIENQSPDSYTYTFGQPGAPSPISSGLDNGGNAQNAHFIMIGTTEQILASADSSRGSQYQSARTNGLPIAIGARFTVLSGVCRFVGFMYEGPEVSEVPIGAANLNGSWVSEPADFAGSSTSQSVWSTDNVGDSLTITVPDCDAVAVMLRAGENSGTVDVMTDGLTAWSGLDTYRASYPALLPLVTAGGSWPNSSGTSYAIPLKGARGSHTVTVKLSGFTVGATAPSAGVRRLSVAGVYALKFSNP